MKWDDNIPWERAVLQLVIDLAAWMIPIMGITLGLSILQVFFPEYISDWAIGLIAGIYGYKIYVGLMKRIKGE